MGNTFRRRTGTAARRVRWGAGAAVAILLAPAAYAADVMAGPPTALSVTIYRAPYRNGGPINLNNLGGFALIKETRLIHLPAGESRLRFEGVVDGIQSVSAIVAGLPGGVIEKNRDAAVLSPEALIRAAMGSEVTLVRTNRKTGKITRVPATIRSADPEGVVFETAAGVEALKCSGLPETFSFDRVPAGLSPTPTLSVMTRSSREVTASVTLSYLANGFDWAANYVAAVAPDDRTLHLTAWITLANGNAVGLPDAHTQIVAGRLNRVGGDQDLSGAAPRVIARCWPTGTTSDQAARNALAAAHPFAKSETSIQELVVTAERKPMGYMGGMAAPAPAPPPPPPPEQLGDLKLYRVPQLTTVASRQSKQVRLLDQADVPFAVLYTVDLIAAGGMDLAPATRMLRTKNDFASHLGLPLPAGQVAVFGGQPQLLTGLSDLRDIAIDENVELKLGPAPDVQVRQTRLTYTANAPEITDLTPELRVIYLGGRAIEEVEISNAGGEPAPFELRLRTYSGAKVTRADQPMAMKDGRPVFRLTVPANGSLKVRYTVADN